MENCIRKFPVVGAMIFNNLDNQSLVVSREINEEISEFIKNERFYWIRIIEGYIGGQEKAWKEVINKMPINVVKQLTTAVENHCHFGYGYDIAPLNIAAEDNNLELCEYIIKNAENGQLDLCKQIIGKSNFSSKFHQKIPTFQS